MTAGHKWAHEESGALAYSQSNGNINVPEHALSRLVEERNHLKAKLAQVEADCAAMWEICDMVKCHPEWGDWQKAAAEALKQKPQKEAK